ncbi:MAG TPA: hypothetical protein VEI73_00070 [Candidatus Acidoferrum sp.]|nr:hypothetical protein [Candidatus Acidoferrum sp.]
MGEPRGLVRTDEIGRFASPHLESKQTYLVLAIDWDKGDTDELAYYRYQQVELTTSGAHEIHIYMGPGKEVDCRGK